MNCGIEIGNLPRAVRIVFQVYSGDREIHWGSATMFNFRQMLRTGHVCVRLIRGACPGPTTVAMPTDQDTAELTVDFPRFDRAVQFIDRVEPVRFMHMHYFVRCVMNMSS